MTAKEIRYFATVLEDIRGQNQAVLEAVSDMQVKVNRIPQIEADIVELKTDMKLVKRAIKELSRTKKTKITGWTG